MHATEIRVCYPYQTSDPFGDLNARMVLRFDGGSVLIPEGDRHEDPGQSGLHSETMSQKQIRMGLWLRDRMLA